MIGKKTKILILFLLIALSLTACVSNQESSESNVANTDITLDDINEFLNNSAGLGSDGIGNAVAIIPHAHIDGPKNETDFYAFVNWKYRARDYIKYQVTYLSCTCREASVNMWQTAYIELTLPDSGNIEDSKIKFISFEEDSTGKYTGGHWGDSDPIPAGQTYEQINEEFISYFVDKDAKYLDSLSIIDDIDLNDYQSGDGRTEYTIDTLTGASVSANNVIRILQATFDFHGTDEFFN